MIDIALDPVGRDLVLAPGPRGVNIVPLGGAERVAQAVAIRLRTWLGEWFLDTTHGVPYVDQILGKGRRPELVEAVLRAQILDVEGVRSIVSFAIVFDAAQRTARVDFVAESSEGLATGNFSISA